MSRLIAHLKDLQRCGKEHFDIETPSRNGTQSLNSLNEYRNLPFSGYRNQRVVSPLYITITNRCCYQIMLGNNKNKKISCFHDLSIDKGYTISLSYGDSHDYYHRENQFLNIFNTNIK
jgi:hypothetical protein